MSFLCRALFTVPIFNVSRLFNTGFVFKVIGEGRGGGVDGKRLEPRQRVRVGETKRE